MEKQHRKLNRLGDYDYGEIGCYFVTLCTQNRARLFQIELPGSEEDGTQGTAHRPFPTEQNEIVHKWIRETQRKFPNMVFDKYVIMPDHLHFIVNIKERHTGRSLPDIMGFFKTMTTNEYIRCVKNGVLEPFDKKLWQKSYYDHVIRNQQDYNEIWEYIQYNPLKWQLTHSTQ